MVRPPLVGHAICAERPDAPVGLGAPVIAAMFGMPAMLACCDAAFLSEACDIAFVVMLVGSTPSFFAATAPTPAPVAMSAASFTERPVTSSNFCDADTALEATRASFERLDVESPPAAPAAFSPTLASAAPFTPDALVG